MNKKAFLLTAVLFLASMAISLAWGAPVIKEIPYSKTTGLADGPYTFRFSLYDAETGGASVWSEQANETVSSGVVEHSLGSVTPLNSSSFLNTQLWVQVERLNGMIWELVGTRNRLAVVPYSLWSDTTTTAGDITKVTAGTGLTGGGESGDVTLNANIGTGANQVAAGSHTHDSAYVNATGDTMTGSLSINQAGTGNAGYFRITNIASSSTALRGETSGSGYAVQGYTLGTGRAGSFEINNAASSATALYAKTNGTGYAIQGYTVGTGRAGHFEISNASSPATALHSRTNGTGVAFHGFTSGTNRAGMFEINNPSSSAAALYAKTNGTGAAGYFDGNLFVSGNIGIGITAPQEKLDVLGAMRITTGLNIHDWVVGATGNISTGTGNFYIKDADTGLNSLLIDQNTGDVLLRKVGIAGVTTGALTHWLHVKGPTSAVLRLEGPGTFGSQAKLNFGDVERVYLQEDVDDSLEIHGHTRIALTGGNVGIGTSTPSRKLHVVGTNPRVLVESSDVSNPEINLYCPGTPNWAMYKHSGTGDLRFYQGGDVFTIKTGGNVGIGTTSPGYKLDVNGDIFVRGTEFNSAGDDATVYFGHPGHSIRGEYGTGVVISAYAAPDALIVREVSGNVAVKVLEITGGSDLSEQFTVNYSKKDSAPVPGMVVSIDPLNPGSLVVSDAAYDHKVAGIISGAGGVNPGMLMGQKGSIADGINPVALSGRVYCWADASTGAIQPGDLLTTSATPGHAMKVSDYTRAQGAILGKAMTGLVNGQGLVMVLVSLQ
jgi:hypothetical protein